MSDLGAIFHVKKSGTQYDAHAYTTTDECPEPNLKIKFNGTAAYIKLEAKGSGDVPCYVKKSDGGVFQVKKEAVALTGSTHIYRSGKFTVPSGIHVIEIYNESLGFINVGVTPNTTHSIYINVEQQGHVHYKVSVGCASHNKTYMTHSFTSEEDEPSEAIDISWSPAINKRSPNVTDYN